MALTKVKGSGLATGAATASLVGIDDNATSTAITIDASEQVGIGTSSPVTLVEAWADTPEITITSNNPLSTSVGSENISSIGFRGQYNNLYRTSARIQARQNGTWSTVTSNIAPTAIDFFTQTSGTGDGMPTPKVSILATGGITFNGDTAAANALDDYETGTYGTSAANGIITAATGSITCGTSFSCKYIKIGNQVTANGWVVVSAVSSPSGQMHITLPFTVGTGYPYRAMGSLFLNGVPFVSDYNIIFAEENSAWCYVMGIRTNTSELHIDASGVSVGDQIGFSVTYQV